MSKGAIYEYNGQELYRNGALAEDEWEQARRNQGTLNPTEDEAARLKIHMTVVPADVTKTPE